MQHLPISPHPRIKKESIDCEQCSLEYVNIGSMESLIKCLCVYVIFYLNNIVSQAA